MSTLATSEALLNEILTMVTKLNSNVDNFHQRMTIMDKTISDLEHKISSIIESGFIESDLNRHKIWHIAKERSIFASTGD